MRAQRDDARRYDDVLSPRERGYVMLLRRLRLRHTYARHARMRVLLPRCLLRVTAARLCAAECALPIFVERH